MIDPENYVKVQCEYCGERHTQVENCPYDSYVAQNYSTALGPITPEFFREIWSEMSEKEREKYA